MKEMILYFTMNQDEQRTIVRGLYDIRNRLLEMGDGARDIEQLIMRIIDAPEKPGRWRPSRDTAR